MLSIFKTNQVFIVFPLLLLAMALHAYPMIFEFDFKPDEPGYLTEFLYSYFPKNGILTAWFFSMLIVIQAGLFNGILSNFRLLRKTGFYTAVFYVVLSCSFLNFQDFHPQILANTFLIWALYELFGIYKKFRVAGNIYNVGFAISIASLFYLPNMVFLLLGFLGMAQLRAFKFREALIMLSGFLVPIFLLFTYQFLTDGLDPFASKFFLSKFGMFDLPANYHFSYWVVIGFFGLLILWAILNASSFYFKTNIKEQKFINLFYLFLIVSFPSIFLLKTLNVAHLSITIIPLSFFLARGFMGIKRDSIANFLFILLISVIIIFQYRGPLVKFLG